jgi:hypothetical protein
MTAASPKQPVQIEADRVRCFSLSDFLQPGSTFEVLFLNMTAKLVRL